MSVEFAVRARRARKPHPCMECDFRPGMHETYMSIQPGDVYLVLTDFKGSDVGYALSAGHPVQGCVCEEHARRHRPLIEARKAKP